MRKLYVTLLVLTAVTMLIGPISPTAFAQSNDAQHDRLRNEISSLREKIKNSRDVRTKDLQKLTELENELQKSQFLNNSKSR